MVLSLQLCLCFAFQLEFQRSNSGCHACVAKTYSCGGIFPAGGVILRHTHTVAQAWLELLIILPQPQALSLQEYAVMPNLLKVQYSQETGFYGSFTFLHIL